MTARGATTDKDKRAQQAAENDAEPGETVQPPSTRFSSRGPLPGVATQQGQGQGQSQGPSASEQAYEQEEDKRSID
ncbi:MAG TPA: hypothetical protein VMJ10_18490 [Kofleriaceae bacterium]|nr:hypothetical protein [Kofleriaceae bacterium]